LTLNKKDLLISNLKAGKLLECKLAITKLP